MRNYSSRPVVQVVEHIPASARSNNIYKKSKILDPRASENLVSEKDIRGFLSSRFTNQETPLGSHQNLDKNIGFNTNQKKEIKTTGSGGHFQRLLNKNLEIRGYGNS